MGEVSPLVFDHAAVFNDGSQRGFPSALVSLRSSKRRVTVQASYAADGNVITKTLVDRAATA
jgi:hypothetical protein